MLVQMAKNIGARAIGTVGTEEKAKLAREAGADEVIIYTQQDFEVETKRLTENKGVHVVYDGVGKSTFEKGLNVLRPRGYMVLFGGASGLSRRLIQLRSRKKVHCFSRGPAWSITLPRVRNWSSGRMMCSAQWRRAN